MALLKYGPLAAAVSGTVGGTVFSHNRGGAYMRTWAKPKLVSSDAAQRAKYILSLTSRLWASVADDDKLAWSRYCVDTPSINRLGDSRTLSGHQAFNAVNSRILQCGATSIDLPPTLAPPTPVYIDSFSVDVSDTSAEIAFHDSPLAATIHLWIWACVVPSRGISFVANRWRLLKITAAAAATPIDIFSDLELRFGTLQAGEYCHIRVQTCDNRSGLVSGFDSASSLIVA